MDIFRKKDEILAALGNIRAMERLHVDTFTEDKINNISGVKIAESREGEFWIDFQELNGYLFMNATILGRINLKTSRGIKLTLLTKEYEIEIDSDEKEIESDFSNVSNKWITKVSFVLDDKERVIVENRNFEALEYQIKKATISLVAIENTK